MGPARQLNSKHSRREEQALVDLARDGDAAAYEALLERYLDRTFNLALRMVGNREDAEDIVQECFARGYRHLHRFRGKSSFGTWITSIAIRLCMDAERRQRRDRLSFGWEESSSTAVTRSSRESPSRRAERRELLARLERSLQALPARLRAALVLRVLEGLPYDEVAASLGTSIRSARMYVFEARKRLSTLLGEELREELG